MYIADPIQSRKNSASRWWDGEQENRQARIVCTTFLPNPPQDSRETSQSLAFDAGREKLVAGDPRRATSPIFLGEE